jgi:hypothetical protein
MSGISKTTSVRSEPISQNRPHNHKAGDFLLGVHSCICLLVTPESGLKLEVTN